MTKPAPGYKRETGLFAKLNASESFGCEMRKQVARLRRKEGGAMPVTLSHYSALDAMRALRMNDDDVQGMDRIALWKPVPWVGKQWTIRAFSTEHWKWAQPSKKRPLHVLVPSQQDKIRMDTVVSHVCAKKLPTSSIIWLNEHASMVCPELLFLQMAPELSLPELVLLGHELCGYYSLPSSNNAGGKVQTQVPCATSVEQIEDYLNARHRAWGVKKARAALPYIADHAASFPEGVLSTIYALPTDLCGYGFGRMELNQRVEVGESDDGKKRHRYPDLLFSFAPIGINYDGEDHLDLKGIVAAACAMEVAEGDERGTKYEDLHKKLREVRSKVVDDIARNRELASRGRIVLPMTKENLYGEGNLDSFTLQLLECAESVFGIDVKDAKNIILNKEMANKRYELLSALLEKA